MAKIKTVNEWLGEGNDIGIDIFNKKYRFNNESFDEFLDRVSDCESDMRKLIEEKKFLYAGRILANYNTGTGQGVSNCTTLAYVEDNLDDIMNCAKDLAMSFKAEAGVGLALSKIRPKGTRVGSKDGGGVSDGIIGFMKIFSSIADNISRGNRRRGALACGLHVDHPDVVDFIRIKKNNFGNEGVIKSANLSVMITDEFMTNYINKTKYRKDFIVESTGEIVPHIVDPEMIMSEIVDHPKRAFEPGVLFVDRYNETHLFGSAIETKVFGFNACMEYFGIKNTTCLLGSLNISAFVNDNGVIDYSGIALATKIAIRGLDRVTDYGVTRNGVQAQNEISKKYRGVGLGITGLADAFVKMGIRYGSKESIKTTGHISELMKVVSLDTSIELGKELGQPSGILEYEKDPKFTGIKGLRNNSLLSIAPAGSLSAMLGVSSGIEPIFRHGYKRMTQSVDGEDTFYTVYHKASKEAMDKNNGEIPEYLVDSSEINYMDKLNIMKAVQDHVDLSISSTVNLPEETTTEIIKNVYIESWKMGLKGNTVYVDKSLEGVLNTLDKPEEVADTNDCSS